MTEQEARAEGGRGQRGPLSCVREVRSRLCWSLVDHLSQQSLDQAPPGAQLLGECQAALLAVVIMGIKTFVSSQALPPVTLSCSARPGATPRENPTLFPPSWLLVLPARVRERPRRPGKQEGSGVCTSSQRGGRGRDGSLVLVAPTVRASGRTAPSGPWIQKDFSAVKRWGALSCPPKLAGDLRTGGRACGSPERVATSYAGGSRPRPLHPGGLWAGKGTCMLPAPHMCTSTSL